MDIRLARGAIRWFLRLAGYSAVTLPPVGVFVLAERANDGGLLAHEAVHWEQYRRMGAVRFYAAYLWGLVRHGYRDHPMEREARERSGSK